MLELVLTDADISDTTIREYKNYSSKVDQVCLPPSLITEFKEYNEKVNISALIGYPYGLDDSKTKIHQIINSHRSGAKSIDFFLNRIHLSNKKYKYIYNELIACYYITYERNMDFRAVIESRNLEPKDIDTICDMLIAEGIPGLILASGNSHIDISDQLIIASQIMKRTSLQVYVGPIWNDDQYTKVAKSKVYGIRFNSTKSLGSILKV